MTEYDDALFEHILHIVLEENRPFSYIDCLCFNVNGKEYNLRHGTFRNKVSALIKLGNIEVYCHSNPAFYTLKGHRFGKPMTLNRMGVRAHNSLYERIKDLPLGKNSLHDIRLWFRIPGIWRLLSNNSDFKLNARSKDIVLPGIKEGDMFIRTTIHHRDSVSVIVGCSYAPIAVDVNGVIRLTNALTIVKERLSSCIKETAILVNSKDCNLLIPHYGKWIVKMWHFGADATIEYSGEKFEMSFDVGQDSLIRAYSKKMRESKINIRLEKQEVPKKSLADAIEEKLHANHKGPFTTEMNDD
jgi:hypothetical protein